MGGYDILAGSYGILVVMKTDKNKTYSLTLDNRKDMFGNTYGYGSYNKQEQAYSLNVEGNITEFGAYLY
jgi:hypothetical protein